MNLLAEGWMTGQIQVRTALVLSVCVFSLALGGCGGGGGGGPRPEPINAAPPAPPPPHHHHHLLLPPPPPPPPVTGTNYNDSEYQRSNGASGSNAIVAYNAGGTGKGVKIGVVDSGINPDLAEFAGRIDPASRDIAGSRGVSDTSGHGTAVSAVLAANRNGSGVMGVAFDSTIISLNTAGTTGCDEKDGCKHSDSAIATAIDVARTNGARVINISLGGDGAGSAVLSAVGRATRAGIVIVMSAGNEGEDPEGVNPGGFGLQSAAAGNGLVILAGAVDANRQITAFSNRAGTGANSYLSAIGSRVRSINEKGEAFLYSGTSFSAPVISGAAALLASAFPNLTGAQIVQLLLSTADDTGEPGIRRGLWPRHSQHPARVRAAGKYGGRRHRRRRLDHQQRPRLDRDGRRSRQRHGRSDHPRRLFARLWAEPCQDARQRVPRKAARAVAAGQLQHRSGLRRSDLRLGDGQPQAERPPLRRPSPDRYEL
jgi:hypothetical protein